MVRAACQHKREMVKVTQTKLKQATKMLQRKRKGPRNITRMVLIKNLLQRLNANQFCRPREETAICDECEFRFFSTEGDHFSMKYMRQAL